MRRRFTSAALLLAAVSAPLAAGNLTSLTTSQELALGQVFAMQVDQQYPLLRDPILTWYVNLRGRQMADVSPRRDIPYFFRVVGSDEINAFAIPGGHIYLNLGLFQIANHEAEVLGVLAHEIGHVVGRHGAEQIVKQQWAALALTGAAYGHRNYYAHLAGNLFGELGFLKMTRDAEREADRFGFEILVASGYDPRAMITMFEKMRELQRHQPNRFEKLFLTHPPTDERIANLKAMVDATTLPDGLRLDSAEFDTIKGRVERRHPYYPPDTDGGADAESPAPDRHDANPTGHAPDAGPPDQSGTGMQPGER